MAHGRKAAAKAGQRCVCGQRPCVAASRATLHAKFLHGCASRIRGRALSVLAPCTWCGGFQVITLLAFSKGHKILANTK